MIDSNNTAHPEVASQLLQRTRVAENGCLEWVGPKDWDGYGMARAMGKQWRAHRLFFFLWNGPIPKGHHVCHRCDNPSCVLPAHLFSGTPLVNVRDCKTKGRNHHPTGTLNGQHRLKEADILAIRQRYAPRDKNGNDMAGIAIDYGVHKVTIWDIIHRRKWASI